MNGMQHVGRMNYEVTVYAVAVIPVLIIASVMRNPVMRKKHWLAFKSLQAKKRRKRNDDENYLTCLSSFSV